MQPGRIAREVRDNPWLIVLLVMAAIAVAFPRVAAGSVALAIAAGAAGVLSQRLRPMVARVREIPARWAGWAAILCVLGFSLFVFLPVFSHSVQWVKGDWGVQDAVLRGTVDHVRHLTLPHWNHRVSTGDAPLELYPALTYVLAAVIALVTGLEDRLALVLLILGVVAHTLIAVGATRIALRFLSARVAAVVGVLLVVDLGNVSSGGVVGTLQYGLLHNAVAQVFALFAVASVIDAVRGPRLRTSISIWVWSALTAAAHPSGILALGICGVTLAGAAVLATDLPRRRYGVALLHLGIGLGLAAVIWLPLGTRLLLYGQHFSNGLVDPGHWLANLARECEPSQSLPIVVYVGYLGALIGVLSRRAVPVVVGLMVVIATIAVSDSVYLALDLAPGPFVARLGASRLHSIVRPYVFIAAGYAATIGVRHLRTAWTHRQPHRATRYAFLAGIAALAVTRWGCAAVEVEVGDARRLANVHAANLEPLAAWARSQMATAGPGTWGRAVFVETLAYYAHITSVTGLPAFHFGPNPDLLLRERFEDLGPDSLRRFNVRWVITDSAKPLVIGDPATEQRIGKFTIRELAAWDGQFARVERGAGRAVVKRLDDDEVDVELVDTDRPALVALGTGYYPRWRATAPDGSAVPVYAYPATPGGKLHVVAAWLRPGLTRFTPDGPLPSDSRGRVPCLVALVLAVAICCIWLRRRWRYAFLRRLAAARALRPGRTALGVAAAAGVVAIVIWGAVASEAPVKALELGGGVRAEAEVSFQAIGSGWSRCDYSRVLGEYRCGDEAVVRDSTATILNDTQPLWPFTTPAILISPLKGNIVAIRVELTRRLAGRFWVGGSGTGADIAITGMPAIATDHQVAIDLADAERTITITSRPSPSPTFVTFVREDTMITLPPPPAAPPEPP